MSSRTRVTVLAENMLKVLQSQRGLGKGAYPLSLQRLAQLTDPGASDDMILSLANPQRKAFSQHAVVLRRALQVPVALRADLPMLLKDESMLAFLVGEARTDANHAVTLTALSQKVAAAYRSEFHRSLEQMLEKGALPSTLKGLLVNGAFRVFLSADIRGGLESAPVASHPASGPVSREPVAFAASFDEVFDRLDRAAGSHNFVSLTALRSALPVPRVTFDEELQRLRTQRRYTLSAVEGRHELTDEERAAGIWEENALLLHVSRKAL